MAINPRNRRPLRVLAALFVIVIGLYGLLASVHTWGEAQLTPKLGLDLEGGTQLILEPKVVGNRPINQGQIDKAVDIIRQRVDGSGVAEAEVATQGGRNIVISLPGKPAQSTVDSLSKSSQLRFRPVLVQAPNTAPAPAPSGTPSATPSGDAVGDGHPARQGHPAGEGDRQALRHGLDLGRVRLPGGAARPVGHDPHPDRDGDAHAGRHHAGRECPGDERPRSGPQPHGSEPDRRERCDRHRE